MMLSRTTLLTRVTAGDVRVAGLARRLAAATAGQASGSYRRAGAPAIATVSVARHRSLSTSMNAAMTTRRPAMPSSWPPPPPPRRHSLETLRRAFHASSRRDIGPAPLIAAGALLKVSM
jgi:hypothetical protein